MAKKYIIYAGGKDLATVGVTQNELGLYYYNGSSYYKPTLDIFDTVKPPAGYSKYLGGSHAQYISNVNRNPIDFSIVAGTSITMNVDVNVIGTNPKDGSWCKVTPVGSSYVIGFVHTYQWASGLVKAGSPICKIAPQSVTGFAPHLHLDEWSNRGLKIRKLVLDGDIILASTTMFTIGDKIKFNENTKLREAFILEDKYFKRGLTVQAGAVGLVRSVEIVNAGYSWYLISFGDDCGLCAVREGSGSYWVAKTTSAVTNVNGSKVVVATDSSAKILELEAKIKELGTSNTKLLAELDMTKQELDEQVKKYDVVAVEKNRYENMYTEAVRQLNEYKANEKENTIRKFKEWFSENVVKVWDWIKGILENILSRD